MISWSNGLAITCAKQSGDNLLFTNKLQRIEKLQKPGRVWRQVDCRVIRDRTNNLHFNVGVWCVAIPKGGYAMYTLLPNAFYPFDDITLVFIP